MNALPLGTLLISVDVERASGDPDRQDSALANRVATTLSRADLPATLAVTQPGASRLADGLLAEFPQAELALLAGESWAGPDAGRRQFAAGLRRHFSRAAEAGYDIRTIALPRAAHSPHADLLVKHGLTVVRGAAHVNAPRGMAAILRKFSGEAASLLVAPRGVRFGLWEVPVSASLPGAQGSLLRAWIDRAVSSRGTFHLRIDVPALLADTRQGMVELGRLVELAASRRDAHRLRVVTLADFARGIRRHRAAPAQSILRAKAA